MGKETAAVTVVAFRAESYSSDGKNLIISLRTKYSSAERKYRVPLDCLKDLLVDLQRLQASKLEHLAESLDQDAGAHQDINSNKVTSNVAARITVPKVIPDWAEPVGLRASSTMSGYRAVQSEPLI